MSKSGKYAEMDTSGKIHVEYKLEPNAESEEAASIRDLLAGGMVTNAKTSGGTLNVKQTIVFEIRDEFDAGKMCEILAMNGYSVKVDQGEGYYKLRYFIHVQPKETK